MVLESGLPSCNSKYSISSLTVGVAILIASMADNKRQEANSALLVIDKGNYY